MKFKYVKLYFKVLFPQRYKEITYRTVVDLFISIQTDNSVGDSHASRLRINAAVIPLSKSKPIKLLLTAFLVFPPNQSASYKLLEGQSETNRVCSIVYTKLAKFFSYYCGKGSF